MQSDIVETSVGAGATVNVLTGRNIEFITDAVAQVDVGLVAAATGCLAEVLIGTDQKAAQYAIPVWAAANRGPIIPDDIGPQGVGVRGDRIIVRITNTTAGALVTRVYVGQRGLA